MNDPVISVKDTDTIKCSNCNKVLMHVYCRPLRGGHKQLLSRVQVGCGYCSDKSYDYEVVGEFRFHPAAGLKVIAFEETAERTIFRMGK